LSTAANAAFNNNYSGNTPLTLDTLCPEVDEANMSQLSHTKSSPSILQRPSSKRKRPLNATDTPVKATASPVVAMWSAAAPRQKNITMQLINEQCNTAPQDRYNSNTASNIPRKPPRKATHSNVGEIFNGKSSPYGNNTESDILHSKDLFTQQSGGSSWTGSATKKTRTKQPRKSQSSPAVMLN
jgi:hypothetical protein